MRTYVEVFSAPPGPKNIPDAGLSTLQVKRTDELSRKMRFFTDQVEKAGAITGGRSGAADPLNMDELEVRTGKCQNSNC